jgi:ribonucleotide reductase beta subunit family protein with ferritin-like domain
VGVGSFCSSDDDQMKSESIILDDPIWSGELNKSKLTWIKETFLPTTHNLWKLGVGKDGSIY